MKKRRILGSDGKWSYAEAPGKDKMLIAIFSLFSCISTEGVSPINSQEVCIASLVKKKEDFSIQQVFFVLFCCVLFCFFVVVCCLSFVVCCLLFCFVFVFLFLFLFLFLLLLLLLLLFFFFYVMSCLMSFLKVDTDGPTASLKKLVKAATKRLV